MCMVTSTLFCTLWPRPPHKGKPRCPDMMGLKGGGNPRRDMTQSSKLDSRSKSPRTFSIDHMAHPTGPKCCQLPGGFRQAFGKLLGNHLHAFSKLRPRFEMPDEDGQEASMFCTDVTYSANSQQMFCFDIFLSCFLKPSEPYGCRLKPYLP